MSFISYWIHFTLFQHVINAPLAVSHEYNFSLALHPAPAPKHRTMILRTERREEDGPGILPGEMVMETARIKEGPEVAGLIIIRDLLDPELHKVAPETSLGQVRTVAVVAQSLGAVLAVCQVDIIVCTATVAE